MYAHGIGRSSSKHKHLPWKKSWRASTLSGVWPSFLRLCVLLFAYQQGRLLLYIQRLTLDFSVCFFICITFFSNHTRLSIFRLLLRQVQNEKLWKSVFEGKTEKSYELAEAVQAKLWVTNLEYFLICLFLRKILHFSEPIFAALLFTLSFRDTQTKHTFKPSL